MKRASRFNNIERTIVQDKRFISTIVSYCGILAIFMNLNSLQSPSIGLMAFIVYFVINAAFLGNAFFKKEKPFFRLTFGTLLLVMLLGFVGWLTLILHNLDVTRVTLGLLAVATLSSLLNRRMKPRNATE